jgi:hypothetical protein
MPLAIGLTLPRKLSAVAASESPSSGTARAKTDAGKISPAGCAKFNSKVTVPNGPAALPTSAGDPPPPQAARQRLAKNSSSFGKNRKNWREFVVVRMGCRLS